MDSVYKTIRALHFINKSLLPIPQQSCFNMSPYEWWIERPTTAPYQQTSNITWETSWSEMKVSTMSYYSWTNDGFLCFQKKTIRSLCKQTEHTEHVISCTVQISNLFIILFSISMSTLHNASLVCWKILRRVNADPFLRIRADKHLKCKVVTLSTKQLWTSLLAIWIAHVFYVWIISYCATYSLLI